MDSLKMLSENMRIHMFKPFKFWADYSDDELSIWTFFDEEEPTPSYKRTRLQIFTPAIRKNLLNMTKIKNTEQHSPNTKTPLELTLASPIDMCRRRLSSGSPISSPHDSLSSGSPLSSPSPRRTRIMSLGNIKPLISPTTPHRRRKS